MKKTLILLTIIVLVPITLWFVVIGSKLLIDAHSASGVDPNNSAAGFSVIAGVFLLGFGALGVVAEVFLYKAYKRLQSL